MTEAELFELVAAYIGNCISAFTVYLTLVLGYLTIAYLIAKNLSSTQATIATAIYVLGALSCVLTLLHSLSVLSGLVDQLYRVSDTYREVMFGDPKLWLVSMAVITFVGLAGSVFFFYSVRFRAEDTRHG